MRHWIAGFLCAGALGTLAEDRFIVIDAVGADAAWARDVSADGTTVVGEADGQAFRWTEAGGVEMLMPGVSASSAHGVSADGNVVVGSFVNASGVEQPYRWSVADGMELLAPNLVDPGVALAVSADGAVVVGEFGGGPIYEDECVYDCKLVDTGDAFGFRWTAADGLQSIGTATGAHGSQATSVSGDGTLVAGNDFYYRDCYDEPCVPVRDFGRPLLNDSGGTSIAGNLLFGDIVASMSSDGSTLVGQSFRDPFLWRDTLGYLPLIRGAYNAVARDANIDGGLVVGDFGIWYQGRVSGVKNLISNGVGINAFGWDFAGNSSEQVDGARRLTVYGRLGLTGVSDDGRTMAGAARDPSGALHPFVVVLDDAPTAGLLDTLPTQASMGPLAATMPLGRSAVVGESVTVFAAMVNSSSETLGACGVAVGEDVPVTFEFVTTDPATNAPIGTPNESFSLAPGAMQTMRLIFTPTAAFSTTELSMAFDCANAELTRATPLLSDVILSASDDPVPDMLMMAQTIAPDGVMRLDESGLGMLAVAAVNVGVAGPVTLSAASPEYSQINLTWCETDTSGTCLAPPSALPLPVNIGAGDMGTFGVFATTPYRHFPDYADNRLVIELTDAAGELRGSVSVAFASTFYLPLP